jgi:hypothetical protein
MASLGNNIEHLTKEMNSLKMGQANLTTKIDLILDKLSNPDYSSHPIMPNFANRSRKANHNGSSSNTSPTSSLSGSIVNTNSKHNHIGNENMNNKSNNSIHVQLIGAKKRKCYTNNKSSNNLQQASESESNGTASNNDNLDDLIGGLKSNNANSGDLEAPKTIDQIRKELRNVSSVASANNVNNNVHNNEAIEDNNNFDCYENNG